MTLKNYFNNKYKIRDSVLIYKKNFLIKIYSLIDFKEFEYEVFDFVPELLLILNGKNTIIDISKKINHYKDFSEENLLIVIEQLNNDNLLINCTENFYKDTKFDRQVQLFNELHASYPFNSLNGSEMQNKIINSKVSIIGAGGLGTWVIMSLVASGIGEINVIDPDIVEKTNLNRQVLYSENDIGKSKVSCINKSVSNINNRTVINKFRVGISNENDVKKYCSDSDVVINCGDYPDVMSLSDVVANACQEMSIPHIVGGGYGGNLGIPGVSVIPDKTLSWYEIRKKIKDNDTRDSDFELIKGSTNKSGSLASISGLIGNMIALEVQKIILNLPLGFSNKFKELDLMTMEWRVKDLKE